ncbi:MAG: hypothetical protein ACLS30_01145 [Oscillospiraceae bacterium]
MDDDEIVELFLKKDESAIIHTAEKYGCRLRSISQRITADILTAEECENDTYLEAWNRIPPNEPEYYGAAEPPVRCGESHLSGLTEPPHFVY